MSKNWEDEAVDIEDELGMSSMGSPSSGFISDTVTGTGEMVVDAVTVLPQAILIEHADELVNMFSPELAQTYREAVAEARKRSPVATTLTELFTPDVIDALSMGAGKFRKLPEILSKLQEMSKGQNVVKGIAGSAGTDAVSQMGEGGEYDIGRTGMAATLGGGLRGGAAIFKNYPARRAGYVGAEPKDFLGKAEDASEASDYMQEVMKEYDARGLFSGGAVTYDPKNYSWAGSRKIKRAFVPPSQKEIFKRIEMGKKAVATETTNLVKSRASEVEDRFIMSDIDVDRSKVTPISFIGEGPKKGQVLADAGDTTSIRSDAELKDDGILVYEDFRKSVDDMVDSMEFNSSAQAKRTKKNVLYQMKKLFGDDLKGEVNLVDIHERRKKMDKAINRDAKGVAKDTVQEQAMQGASHILRSFTKDKLFGTPFERLNKEYGDLASIERGITEKVLQPPLTKMKSGILAGNLGYAASAAAEMAGDFVGGPVGQMSRNVQKTPLGSVLGRGVRKLTPTMSEEQQPIMSREPQSFNPMPIQEQMDMNLPKELLKTKLPRNTEGLQSNSQIFKMKVAQDAENLVLARMQKAGVDTSEMELEDVQEAATELYSNIAMVLDENPDEVASMLPMWIQQFPQLFEKDRYGRIEGVVPSSRRPEVREEIRKNSEISNKERITQLDLLNRSGEYKG